MTKDGTIVQIPQIGYARGETRGVVRGNIGINDRAGYSARQAGHLICYEVLLLSECHWAGIGRIAIRVAGRRWSLRSKARVGMLAEILKVKAVLFSTQRTDCMKKKTLTKATYLSVHSQRKSTSISQNIYKAPKNRSLQQKLLLFVNANDLSNSFWT